MELFRNKVDLWFKPRTFTFNSGGHFVHWSGTVLAILEEGHLSNILMKFECNLPRGIEKVGI